MNSRVTSIAWTQSATLTSSTRPYTGRLCNGIVNDLRCILPARGRMATHGFHFMHSDCTRQHVCGAHPEKTAVLSYFERGGRRCKCRQTIAVDFKTALCVHSLHFSMLLGDCWRGRLIPSSTQWLLCVRMLKTQFPYFCSGDAVPCCSRSPVEMQFAQHSPSN